MVIAAALKPKRLSACLPCFLPSMNAILHQMEAVNVRDSRSVKGPFARLSEWNASRVAMERSKSARLQPLDNGRYRERDWHTRVGTVELLICTISADGGT